MRCRSSSEWTGLRLAAMTISPARRPRSEAALPRATASIRTASGSGGIWVVRSSLRSRAPSMMVARFLCASKFWQSDCQFRVRLCRQPTRTTEPGDCRVERWNQSASWSWQINGCSKKTTCHNRSSATAELRIRIMSFSNTSRCDEPHSNGIFFGIFLVWVRRAAGIAACGSSCRLCPSPVFPWE